MFLFKGVIFRFHVNFPGCKDATFLWLCFQTNFIQQRIENWASGMNEFIPLQHQNWVTWTAWGSSISQLLNDIYIYIYVKGCKVTSPRPAKRLAPDLETTHDSTRFCLPAFVRGSGCHQEESRAGSEWTPPRFVKLKRQLKAGNAARCGTLKYHNVMSLVSIQKP